MNKDINVEERVMRIERMLRLYFRMYAVPKKGFRPNHPNLTQEENEEFTNLVHSDE